MIRNIVLFLSFAATLCAADANWKLSVQPLGKLSAASEVPMQVKVTDAKGAPIDAAQVELVLTMVEMDHGEFKHAAKQSKPGLYDTKAKFIMSGAWNIEVRAKKGADSATKKFRFDVKD